MQLALTLTFILVWGNRCRLFKLFTGLIKPAQLEEQVPAHARQEMAPFQQRFLPDYQ